ncbi:carbohydrate ABC transporter permease [Paenibacillus nasutitermitis]|uniref:ABC transporter permease protein YtcP n=1 Tax=Paenibacillus nasutitermitis TaxID=1652958 RepID=A0A916ZDI2_9BACL|nr:carbohydrate ABC transporter permease [Paenibacillus nasutitermitis]GGD88639.1 putative ABC transporter permease protein YtcP [Paenibacillus nasutitermitis]
MHHRNWLDRASDWLNVTLLLLVSAAMIVPFLYIFSVSFSSMEEFLRKDFIFWPDRWVTDAYTYILANDKFVKSILITVLITVLGTLLNLAFTSTMAYGLSKKFYGQRIFLFMVLFTFLFSAGIIPTYLIVKETGLLNSIWSLIIPVLISPWNLIVFSQFFKSIPEELNEAALIDGASEFTVFNKIILPLSKPALATFGLFYAVSHWNSYFTGILYISNPNLWPIQVLLRQIVVVNDTSTLQVEQMVNVQPPPAETIQMAAILLATIPILIVYPFLQKHFAKGVMIGSVKG